MNSTGFLYVFAIAAGVCPILGVFSDCRFQSGNLSFRRNGTYCPTTVPPTGGILRTIRNSAMELRYLVIEQKVSSASNFISCAVSLDNGCVSMDRQSEQFEMNASFQQVTSLVPYIAILMDGVRNCYYDSACRVAREWDTISRYLATFLRSRGLSRRFCHCTKTAVVNEEELRNSYLSRRQFRFAVMAAAETILTDLLEKLENNLF